MKPSAIRYAAVLALLLSVAGVRAADSAPPAPTLEQQLAKMAGKATAKVIYRGVTVFAGTGAAPRSGMAIVVQGERIAAIVPAAQLDAAMLAGAEIVDAQGQFAIAGLIDSHVHNATQPARAWAEAELKRNLYGGVTGVRDMAGDARALADLSRAALVNEIASPDIFYAALVAGPSFFQDPRTVAAALGMRAGAVPWLYAVTDQTDLALALAQARGTGATGLKIYANLPGNLVRGLIAEAHRQHFPVWTHQQVYPATPYDSLGADAVSHVCMIARFIREPGKQQYGHGGEPSYAGLTAADPGIAAYIAALRASGTYMDATLSVYAPPAGSEGKPQPSNPHCPLALAGDITHAMLVAGVPLMAGTDSNTTPEDPFPALDRELELLVRAGGLTPAQAIVAATRNAATALGKQDDFGTLEPGKYANLVLLKADPLADIGNLRSLTLTVKRGLRFPRADYQHHAIPAQD